MRHAVVGTAGHIDHGKSSLVRALTGTDPDRLAAERERGITIELGFADLDLGESRTVSFVDVPGHERFVRHMVAGATGIDAVLLVVASDEGIARQTEEHLAICELLGVRTGFVVLSKSDLVEPDLADVVRLELEDRLAGTFLAGCPVVSASARTGDGLDTVRACLASLVERLEARSSEGIERLAVDRSFVMPGFGTVVTGTLASGRLAEGQEVEILPGGRRAKVRGLQVHGVAVDVARAGRRTAVNLIGVSCEDVPRGVTLTRPGGLPATRRIWAELELLPDAPDSLRRGGEARLHVGTSEAKAQVRVLRERRDGRFDVEIHFEREVVAVAGDRFVLRRSAPVDTVGGGIVRDARPPRFRKGRTDLDAIASTEDAVGEKVARAGLAGLDERTLAAELGRTVEQVARELDALEGSGRIVRLRERAFPAAELDELDAAVDARLAGFHRDEPLRAGMSREGLRAELARSMPVDAWRARLESRAAAGDLRLEGDRVAHPDHRVELDAESAARRRSIEAAYREAWLDPPEARDVLVDGNDSDMRLLELLIAAGVLVRVKDGRLFHSEAIASVIERLRDYARTSRRIDVAGFKELVGVSRKNAIPLLEYLDAERKTRRVGNVREILDA